MMITSTECLALMAVPDAYARWHGLREIVITVPDERNVVIPSDIFDLLEDDGFVMRGPGGEYMITPEGRIQAKHGTQASG